MLGWLNGCDNRGGWMDALSRCGWKDALCRGG